MTIGIAILAMIMAGVIMLGLDLLTTILEHRASDTHKENVAAWKLQGNEAFIEWENEMTGKW